MDTVHKSVHEVYEHLRSFRDPILERGRACAKLTIPSLLTEDGHGQDDDLEQPWQSLGARGVNNLSAKLLLTLMPANGSFFRLVVDIAELIKESQKAGQTVDKEDIEKRLAQVERIVMQELEVSGIRPSVFEALKHLLVVGNVLLHWPRKGGLKVYHLDRYVVCRDRMGKLLRIVVKESVSWQSLPEGMQDILMETCGPASSATEKIDPQKPIDIYTTVHLKEGHWEEYQEIKGIEVPGSRGRYPEDKPAWFAPRMIKVDGEDYGRSFVEEYIGDLRALDALSQAVVEGSAGAAKMLWRVAPDCLTSPKEIAEAANGGFVVAQDNQIECIQAQKNADLAMATTTVDRLTRELSQAFLLNSSIQRNGERVTAEEIRLMANELEAALGGVYSLLSQEFQLPLVQRVMAQMELSKKLPALPKNLVKPAIVTGLEALGRGNDLQKLNLFVQNIQAISPEMASQSLNFDELFKRIATALSLEVDGLIKTPEQVAQERQAAMMQQMAGQLAPEGMKMAGKMMEQGNIPNGQGAPVAQPGAAVPA